MDKLINEIFKDLSIELDIPDKEGSMLLSKVSSAYREVKGARSYPMDYEDDFICSDMERYYSNIKNLALYDYSDVSSIDTQTAKTDFATYENNRWLADGKMVFLPKSGIQNTGYVSLAVSDENGLFAENPIITRTLEAKYKAYGIYIEFGKNLPKKFVIRTYSDNVLHDTVTIQSGIAENFELQYDFAEYDKIEIEFVETEPHNRIHLNYISLGSETAYKLEYDDLYSTPVGTQLDKIKNVKVARYLYSKSNVEDDLTSETLVYDGNNAIYYMTDACYGYRAIIEEAKSGQSIEIKSSGAYYVELAISGVSVGEEIKIAVKGYKYNVSTAYTVQTINNRGTDKEWQNPLISNAEHGKLVTAWLADYFASGIQYELDYRGEHFSLTDHDQTSLVGLQTQVASGEENIPWHTSDETKHCKFYSNADMAKITATAMTFVTWHITYFRDLRIYIRSLESKEDVGRITYGTGIPEAYQSEPLKAMLAQKS